MTAMDLVEVVAGAMYCSDADEIGQCGDEAYYQRQALAVLAALAETGNVEWGVRYQTYIEPVVQVYHSRAVARAMLEEDDSGGVLVSRFAGKWEVSA